MNEITRYAFCSYESKMAIVSDGNFVRIEDYEQLQADNAWLRELVQLFKCDLSDCEFYKHQVCVLNECPFEQALESGVTE